MHRPEPPRSPPTGPSDVGETVDACLRDAAGTLSENTVRALKSDLAVFADWCHERGLTAVPAKAATLAAFVADMAEARAPATVRRYVASVAAVHRALGGGQPARSTAVKAALRRMHRRRGRRQAQARGLTWALRQRLLEASGERLIDARNRALLAVAYDAMLRRSEIVALEVADLIEEVPGYATLLVRCGKTDPEGRGATVYLARDTVALVQGVAGPRRLQGRSAVPLGEEGRGRRRTSAPVPGASHPEGDGAGSRAAPGGGGQPVRAQSAGRRGSGHGGVGHRDAGHPAGRALEDGGNGQPLQRATPGAAQRVGAAREAAAQGVARRRATPGRDGTRPRIEPSGGPGRCRDRSVYRAGNPLSVDGSLGRWARRTGSWARGPRTENTSALRGLGEARRTRLIVARRRGAHLPLTGLRFITTVIERNPAPSCAGACCETVIGNICFSMLFSTGIEHESSVSGACFHSSPARGRAVRPPPQRGTVRSRPRPADAIAAPNRRLPLDPSA